MAENYKQQFPWKSSFFILSIVYLYISSNQQHKNYVSFKGFNLSTKEEWELIISHFQK